MLSFPRSNNTTGIDVSADENGIFIATDIWTVPIPKNMAKTYAKNYSDTSIKNKVNEGFFDWEGKVCLTHNDAKIMLSKSEANDLIDLIEKKYL
ncbi:MAG: hypothetical protein V7749_00230 [Cocleimonas sp.]|jgi:hypothetical protein